MAEERCPFCQATIARTDKTCPHCQRPLTGKAMQQTAAGLAARGAPDGFPAIAALMLVAALGACGLGLLFASQATIGVAAVAVGCVLAVWARMLQASAHHRDAMSFRRE